MERAALVHPSNDEIAYRKAAPSDAGVIREMLYHAIFVPPGTAPPSRDILRSPDLARYCADWGRRDDRGWIAEDRGAPVGAVWLRLWNGAERGYGFLDARTPELSIAVLPPYRGRGIGGRLLELAIREARGRFSRISLSVSKANPARRLYARFGFRETAESDDSELMVLAIPQATAPP